MKKYASSSQKRRLLGLSMIEMLIALAIFATVFALSSKGIITGIQGQALQDDIASTQSRLRRVSEVITQQLRGTVFGSISSLPYLPGENDISFAVLDGSGGFQVLPDTSDPNVVKISNINILASSVTNAASLGLTNQQALIINDPGILIGFTVNNVQSAGGTYQLKVSNASCSQTLTHSDNTLLFKGNLVGLHFDKDKKILYRKVGANEPAPLAYNISDFKIRYIYKSATGDSITRTTPYFINGQAVNQGIADGSEKTLFRIEVFLSAEQDTAQGKLTRSYSSQIDLADSSKSTRIRRISGVSVCN